tara:strand:+ start:10254 stop:10676 length:423 start_codon:yes stop_codon:yes gene_type:complete
MLRTKVVFTEWAPDKYPARVKTLLQQYSPVIGQQFQTEIKTSQFKWPGVTKRKNGEIARSPRDIVDLGNFLRSQTPGKVTGNKKSGYALSFTWTAPYALAIYLGYYNNQFQKQKARDWVGPALVKTPMSTFFAAKWMQTK